MTGDRAAVDRRAVLRTSGLLGLLAAVPACTSPYARMRLTLATGGRGGVYYKLGTALAPAWQEKLDLDVRPEVLETAGSVDNLQLLASGATDIIFSQIDTAVEQLSRAVPGDPRALRALARIYDDFVHVVVPESSSTFTLAELRGSRVSVGAPNSGVLVIAKRLLMNAGLDPNTDLRARQLDIRGSVDALENGDIDAFFWSGGLPTPEVEGLANALPIRLLDLEDVVSAVRADYPVYAPGTVPAMSYNISEPITTLTVRNVLLVGAGMADDLANDLVKAMFEAQEQLARTNPAALTINLRAAIGTQPVPLHPGAVRFFRASKNS